MQQMLDGGRVLRSSLYASPSRGFVRRIPNPPSFPLSSLTAIRKVGPTDVIFVESPPLLIGLAVLAFRRFKRAPFIFNVSDIWPQSAVELGALRNGLAIRLAEKLARHPLRQGATGNGVTPRMIERLG